MNERAWPEAIGRRKEGTGRTGQEVFATWRGAEQIVQVEAALGTITVWELCEAGVDVIRSFETNLLGGRCLGLTAASGTQTWRERP